MHSPESHIDFLLSSQGASHHEGPGFQATLFKNHQFTIFMQKREKSKTRRESDLPKYTLWTNGRSRHCTQVFFEMKTCALSFGDGRNTLRAQSFSHKTKCFHTYGIFGKGKRKQWPCKEVKQLRWSFQESSVGTSTCLGPGQSSPALALYQPHPSRHGQKQAYIDPAPVHLVQIPDTQEPGNSLPQCQEPPSRAQRSLSWVHFP